MGKIILYLFMIVTINADWIKAEDESSSAIEETSAQQKAEQLIASMVMSAMSDADVTLQQDNATILTINEELKEGHKIDEQDNQDDYVYETSIIPDPLLRSEALADSDHEFYKSDLDGKEKMALLKSAEKPKKKANKKEGKKGDSEIKNRKKRHAKTFKSKEKMFEKHLEVAPIIVEPPAEVIHSNKAVHHHFSKKQHRKKRCHKHKRISISKRKGKSTKRINKEFDIEKAHMLSIE